jgi:alpha-1,3-rhamnosyl/mannosyltransferase
MRVAIDYLPALLRPAGIGRFTAGLVEGLSRVDPAGTYLLSGVFFRGFPGGPDRLVPPDRPNVRPVFRRIPARLFRRAALRAPRTAARLLGNPELFHCTDFTEPLLSHVPVLATLHDVAYETEPSWYPEGFAERLRRRVARILDRGAWLLTVSESSRSRILECLSIEPGTVHSVRLGVDADRFGGTGAAGFDEAALARLGLAGRRYLLSVGTIQPRKNVDGLLEAFRRARARGLEEILVVAGRPGWHCAGVLGELRELEGRGEARYLGYVPEEILPALHRGSTAHCCLSHEEGFGLPVLEAMAAGKAAVISRAPALIEVAGEAAIAVDSRSPDEAADAFLRISRDEELRGKLAAAATRRASRFTWEECARGVRSVYARMLGRGEEAS